MEAGIKYLMIEKPLATSVEECEELIAWQRSTVCRLPWTSINAGSGL